MGGEPGLRLRGFGRRAAAASASESAGDRPQRLQGGAVSGCGAIAPPRGFWAFRHEPARVTGGVHPRRGRELRRDTGVTKISKIFH